MDGTKLKKTAVTIILGALFLVIGYQVFNLNSRRAELASRLGVVNEKIEKLETENRNLQTDLEYFVDLENLAKEFKSQFNYKRPGEKLIIVVPESSQ